VGAALNYASSSKPSFEPESFRGLTELQAAALAQQNPTVPVQNQDREPNRVLTGYKVWRLLATNQTNEDLWTLLTPTAVVDTTYTDTAWSPLPSGVYKFAVKAVYTNNVLSNAELSNEIHKGMMGVLTGTVTEFGTNVPIQDAVIAAGDYSGTSNARGLYPFLAYQGTYNQINRLAG
jgi:hypothetical protein